MSDNFEFSLCYNLREGESVCCYGRKELPWSCRLLHVLKWMKKTNVRREYPDICVVTIIHKAIKYKEQWGIVIGKETSGKTGSIHFSSSTIVPSQADHSKQKSNCYLTSRDDWWGRHVPEEQKNLVLAWRFFYMIILLFFSLFFLPESELMENLGKGISFGAVKWVILLVKIWKIKGTLGFWESWVEL